MRCKSVALAITATLCFSAWTPARADGELFPTNISLPDGFRPEGIAIGALPIAYFGSQADGSIYRVDLLTGIGKTMAVAPGFAVGGLKVDEPKHRIFIACGAAGARVIDAINGRLLANYKFASGGASLANDVIIAQDGAWFTDSFTPALYELPFGLNGELPTQGEVVHLPLSGDIVFGDGFNSNGIVTSPDGRSLIIVQSNTGKLFRVDPHTGVTRTVDLGGEVVFGGDGLLRQGRTLYVVQNISNQVAKIELDDAASRGRLISRTTDPRFDIPTTVAAFGDRLYVTNARFTTPPTPTTPYNVIAIRAP